MRPRLSTSTIVASTLALVACAPPPAPPTPPAPPPAASAAASAMEPTVAKAPPRPLPTFENPGGMWMPSQIGAHAAKLKELGLAIEPASLADPTSGTLSAVVSLGGCSASFVSPEGLVATNHHCATGALQHNSSPAQNLLKDGFLAKTRADEKSNGPQARIYVTQKVSDVTAKVTDGLAKIADDRARFRAIESRQKELVAACEKGRKIRCSVSSFYEGAQFFLVEQLEIRDVRLVWAPPSGVGNYGGEIDNWRWPRHTGDVSMFRAYVGKDGQPADYAPDNVPYKPPHWLKVAKEPLREGDLVFVAGYPARTSTLKTAAEVNEAVTWGYPRRQKMLEEYLARLEETTKDDKEAQIRATSYVRRFGNYLTNTKGQLEGLVKGGLAGEKARIEKELRAFIDADPARKAAYGSVLDDIAKELEKNAKHRENDASLKDEVHLAKLVWAASVIVRMAEERAKPDAERDPEYQERNWPRHEQAMKALATAYHRKVDEALLRLALERASSKPKGEPSNPATSALFGAKAPPAPPAIAEKVAKLYEGTKLADEKVRLELLKKSTPAELAASKDPLIAMAVALRPAVREAEERQERMAGRLALVKPKYIEALKAFRKEPFAPDANSTLRITYGTVRGYRPSPEASPHKPFTVLSEVVAKNKGKEPFDVPERLLAAQRAKKVGPYVDDRLGEIPVDFLADLHITGGNSGSATLNAKGELVGLVFDGNYEAMASDWLFVPAVTRSIHVDVRYVLWLLDAVDEGDHLIREMGLDPKL
ncbi:MAG: S46 family peptidase [Deltaproteobacteria bacterium]|nr:S46 family peptidase [Deltaproteobacteria bacterium]